MFRLLVLWSHKLKKKKGKKGKKRDGNTKREIMIIA
jgi:hypothetical protein